jgi:peptidoglycan hydrolase-like protein with peptidoglycan-binding domain
MQYEICAYFSAIMARRLSPRDVFRSFSTVIDGYFGENLSKAIAGFEVLQGLPVDGKLGPGVLGRLIDNVPAVQAYAITADDVSDLVESIPTDYTEQAKMEHLASSRRSIQNPTAAFNAGETIAVAMPGAARTGVVPATLFEFRR